MYIRDDKTDEIIAKHVEIQQSIRSGPMMGIVPGHGAHLMATMALTLGCMGSGVAAYGLSGDNRTVLVFCLALSLGVAAFMSYLIYRVLGGDAAGRRRLYVFAVALVACSLGVLAAATIQLHGDAMVVASGGLAASIVAARCVAGANYALFAAFFRARRAYANFVNEEVERVRREGSRGSKRR